MSEKCGLCEQPVLKKILVGKIVAIDVGHGWNTSSLYDLGATGNGTHEQIINAKVANRAKKILETLGAVVHVFDYSDAGSPRLWLAEKGKRAGIVRADVFVSIHHNAFNGSAQGTETLVHSQATDADVKLAQSIHKQLIANLKLTDRGVKYQRLGVLAGCPPNIPACLTEAFFIDSVRFKGTIPDEVLEAEALAISLGIKDYLVTL